MIPKKTNKKKQKGAFRCAPHVKWQTGMWRIFKMQQEMRIKHYDGGEDQFWSSHKAIIWLQKTLQCMSIIDNFYGTFFFF